MQSGMNIIYTGLFFKGNPAAKAWDQVVLGPVDVTIEPQTGKWMLVAYGETEKLFEDVIDEKMKIKLRDNFIQWTMQREGKKEMYGLRIKELTQATKLNEELHTILSSKAPAPSPNERALRIKLSDDEYISINCKIDSSMMQVMKQLATLKHFDSTQFALSVATPSGGSPQSLRPSSILRDLGASSVLVMRRRRKTAYEAPKISTDKITEKPKTTTNESTPCIAVEVTFPSSETRSFNVPPSILLPELLSVVCNSAGLKVSGHAFDLPIENISKIKLQQLRLSQLTVIEKEVPESEKSIESTDSGNSKYANIKKPPLPPLSPSSSSRRATVHAQAPPPPSSPSGRRATVHAQAPPPPSSPSSRRVTVHAQAPPPPSSPSSKRTTSQFVPMQAPPMTTPTIKPLSPTIQAHMRLRSGSSPSTNRDVNDAISSMLTQQAVGKATPTGVSLSPLIIKKSAPAESKSKRAAPPPPPGKEDGTSPRIGRQNSPMVQKKATPTQEEVDGGTKSKQVPSYRQHGIPLPSMVKGNKAGGGEAETRNGSMKVSISPTVGRRQKKPATSIPPPSQPPPPPPTSDNVNASSGTLSHVRKPSRKAPTKPPGSGEPPPDPAPSPASDPAAKIEKPAPDPAVKLVRAAPSNAPIKFKVPPPPPRKKQETVNAKENIEIVKDTRKLQEKKEKEKEEEKEEEEEEEEDSEEDETDSDDSSAVAGGYDIQQKDDTSSSASSTTDEDSKRELEELDTSEPVTWQQYKEEAKESEEEKSIDSSDDDNDDDDDDNDEKEDNSGIVLIAHKQSTTDEPIDLRPPSPPPDPLIQEAVHKLTHFNEDNEKEEEKGGGAVNMSTLNELDNMVASLRLLIADTCEIGGTEVTPTQLTGNHDDKSLDAIQVTSMAPPADVPKTPPLPPPTSIHSMETTDAPSQAGPPPPPPPPPPPIGPVEKKRPPPVVKPKPKPKDTQTSRSVPGHGSGDDGMEELKQKLLQRQAKMQREQTSQDTNEEKRGQLKEDTSREPARETSNATVIREGAGGGGGAAAGNDMQAQLNMLQQQMLQQQMMQLQQQFQQLQQQLIAGGGGGGGQFQQLQQQLIAGGGGGQFNPLLMQQSFPMPPGSMLGQYPMYGVGGATSVTMPTTSIPTLGQGQQQLYPNMPPYTSGAPPFPPSFAMQGAAPVPVPPPIATVTPPTSLMNLPVSEGEVVKRDRKTSEADRRSVALGNQEGQFDNLMEEVRDTNPDQILNKVPENQGGQDLADTDMTAAINKAMEERRQHLSTSSSVDAEKNADDDDDEWEENL